MTGAEVKTVEGGDEQQTKGLAILKEIGQTISASLELEETLEAVLATTRRLIDYTAAEISLWERDSQSLVVCAQAGDPTYTTEAGGVYGLDEGYSGWMARHREPLLILDAAQRTDVRPKAKGVERPIASFVGVPLLAGEELVGTLELVSHEPRAFDQEDLDLLLIIANQAATAVENARLYRRLREERDRLIRAQEEVRHELARSLHDGTVQRLASLAMGLEHMKRLWQEKPQDVPGELDSLHKMATKAAEEARLLLFELRPVILETQGLVPALEAYLLQLPRYERLEFHLDAHGFNKRLNSQVERTIFSIVQEAVNNARRHAGAQNIRLELKEEEKTLVVTVEDDGRGFDVAAREKAYADGHFGLLNMRERARLIESDLSLTSTLGRGTKVVLRVSMEE